MSWLKGGNRRTLEKRQAMKIGERVGNFFVVGPDLSYLIQCAAPRPEACQVPRLLQQGCYLPNMALAPSQIAPSNPATMTDITALNVKLCACSTLLRHRLKC